MLPKIVNAISHAAENHDEEAEGLLSKYRTLNENRKAIGSAQRQPLPVSGQTPRSPASTISANSPDHPKIKDATSARIYLKHQGNDKIQENDFEMNETHEDVISSAQNSSGNRLNHENNVMIHHHSQGSDLHMHEL